jgi:hypothetical protein
MRRTWRTSSQSRYGWPTASDATSLPGDAIQDPVDPRPLAEIVLRNSTTADLGGEPVSARVLRDLRPAANAPFFWECFFQKCQRPIPFGSGYEQWREQVAAEQGQGKALWYLGHEDAEQSDEPDATLA